MHFPRRGSWRYNGRVVHSDLVAYIREQTQDGITADSLRVALMEAGWPERDVENALHDVAAGLHPVTAGASIHEDLAQVRGMVAHLAGRVRTLEARLTGVPLELPMQQELPGAPLALPPAAPAPFWPRHMIAILFGWAAFLFTSQFAADWAMTAGLLPSDQALFTGAAGAGLLVVGYIAMRLKSAWLSSLITDGALGILGSAIVVAQSNGLIETSTAIAIGILLLVLLVVMELWIDRLMQR